MHSSLVTLYPSPFTATGKVAYDNHGNIQSLPNVTAFTWDFQDRVKEADLGGGGTAYYTYNAQGERIRKVIHNNSDVKIKETIYLDGYEVYHEFVTGNVDFERQTLHVNDDESRVAMVETKTIENGTPVTTPVPRIRYQHSDHLGSCSVETSDTGALISFEEYYPYGGTSFQSTSSSSQVSAKRYRYNGKEKDEETNLYYYGARWYDAVTGRWMEKEPLGFAGSDNFYSYCDGDPVNRVDIDGKLSALATVAAAYVAYKGLCALIKWALESADNFEKATDWNDSRKKQFDALDDPSLSGKDLEELSDAESKCRQGSGKALEDQYKNSREVPGTSGAGPIPNGPSVVDAAFQFMSSAFGCL